MSVHDAEPGDIYADEQGTLWRVVGVCREPSVQVEKVEPDAATQIGDRVEFRRQRQRGGVSGLMWSGFKRILRPRQPTPMLCGSPEETCLWPNRCLHGKCLRRG